MTIQKGGFKMAEGQGGIFDGLFGGNGVVLLFFFLLLVILFNGGWN